MLDNKWQDGNVEINLSQLPTNLFTTPKIKPLKLSKKNSSDAEVMLLFIQEKNKAKEYIDRDISISTKSGMISTSYGPLCFVLFSVPDPATGNIYTYENTVNPKNNDELLVYKQLADQKYWHMVLADNEKNVVTLFEFSNGYSLKYSLEEIENSCKEMQVTDFRAAQTEYEKTYSVEQLLEI